MSIDKNVRRIIDHLWGPTGSIILHIIIIVLLLNLVFQQRKEPEPPDPPARYDTELPDFTPDPKPAPENDTDDDGDDMDRPIDRPLSDEVPEDNIDRPEIAMDVPWDLPVNPSAPKLPASIATRTEEGREEMGKRYGCSSMTEAAVVRALDWLKENQVKQGDEKGSWAAEKHGAAGVRATTGLALLAFLAHGETTGSEEYGETVEMAIRYLRRSQQEDGLFVKMERPAEYAHGIATYAISEAVAMTRIPFLRDSMDAAVHRIIDGQQSGGGWDYAYSKGSRRDTSVAGWQIQALKAAQMAECEVPGLKEAIDRAVGDLKRNFVANESCFTYTDKARESMAPIGALCLQLCGYGRDDEVSAAVDSTAEERCSWDTDRDRVLYYWYYLTQAKFHSGGKTWDKWNKQFASEYVENQQEDGHWKSPSKNDNSLGPAYTTSLGALTLQVYYRYLPTYQSDMIERHEKSSDEGDSDEEIDINII